MSIKNMPQSLNGREWSKFKEKVIGGVTYSAIVMEGTMTASVEVGDTMSVRNSTPADLKAEVYQSTASNLKMIDVGGGGGGGNTLYQSPEDFVVTYSTSTRLLVSGISYTPETEQLVKVTEFPASGAANIYTPATNGMAYDSNGYLDVTGAAFVSTSNFRVEIVGPDKGYNEASDATKTEILNPDSQQYSGETLGSVTNVASGGTTYNYYVDMSGYKYCAFQYEKGGTASTLRFSVDATLQDDGTAAGSCVYQDVGANGHTNISGSTTDSYTADAYLIMKPEMNAKYFKATVAQSGTYGTMDFDLYCKKWN